MPAPGSKQRDLTQESFRELLAFLDPDTQRAAAQYEKVREKLIRLFEWRGCTPGADYADETIDRVARRIQEGIEREPDNPFLYFHGVALNVIREKWRRSGLEPVSLEALRPAEEPRLDPLEADRVRKSRAEDERRMGCLAECLDHLPPVSRELLTVYHLGGVGRHIGRRKDLAVTLKLSSPALRLRVYRVRRQLERCMKVCLGVETFRGTGH